MIFQSRLFAYLTQAANEGAILNYSHYFVILTVQNMGMNNNCILKNKSLLEKPADITSYYSYCCYHGSAIFLNCSDTEIKKNFCYFVTVIINIFCSSI